MATRPDFRASHLGVPSGSATYNLYSFEQVA